MSPPVRLDSHDELQVSLDAAIQLLDEADPEDPRFWVAVEYAANLLENWSRMLAES